MHVHRMEDGRIPKNLLNGKLEFGLRPVGTPKLRLRDVYKQGESRQALQAGKINDTKIAERKADAETTA